MVTFTTKLGFAKPAIDGDDDAWGGMINGNADILEAQLGDMLTQLLTCGAGLTAFGIVTLDRTAAVSIANALQSVYTGTIGLTQPLANRIYQRDTRTGGLYGAGAGSVVLTINPSQPITRLDHRVREGGTVVQDWTNSVPPLSAGSQQIALTVPAGLHTYLIDLRANGDAASIVSTTNAVMVGELVAFSGQSLAEDMVTNAASGDPTTDEALGLAVGNWGFVFASFASNTGAYPPVADGPDQLYPPGNWLKPGGGSYPSTFAIEFLNRLSVRTGVPCGMIGYAVGGSAIDSWLPGYVGVNSGHWAKLVNVLSLAGGNFSAFIWDQGHYETKNDNTPENYTIQLQQLFSAISAAFPAAGAYKKLIGTIPAIEVPYGDGPMAIEMVRATAKQFVAADASAAYVDALDVDLFTDGVHPGQAGNIVFAQHFYRAFANLMGWLTRGDKGPVITGASRAYGSADITLSVSQINGGTAWQSAGTPANQFTVYPAGTSTTPLALHATTPINLTDPTKIVLKLAAAPTEPAGFDVWYRRPVDAAGVNLSAIYDNVTDGDGITQGRQLWDPAAAISVAVASITFTVTPLADRAPSAAITVSGTYSPVAPGPLEYSLDGLVWIAAGATIGAGTFSFTIATGPSAPGPYRVRFRDIAIPSNAGTTTVFLVTQAGLPTLPTIANQIFVFDAYASKGAVFRDIAMTEPAAIGDAIQGLADVSGASNHFAQASTVLAPKLLANTKNSMPGLRFTGSLLQYLRQNGGTLSSTMKASTGFGLLVIYTPATLPTVVQDVIAIGRPALQGTSRVRVHQLSTGVVRAARNGDVAPFYNAATPSAVTATTLTKTVSRYDGTANTLKIKANGLAEGSVATAGTFANPWTEQSTIGVADNLPLEGYFDGWIHEIRVWNTTLSDTNRDDLITYATAKWGS